MTYLMISALFVISFCFQVLDVTQWDIRLAEADERSNIQSRPLGYLAISQFNQSHDGWTIANTKDPRVLQPSYVAAGGNPDGHLSHADYVAHSVWYWQAPAKFLGDMTPAYRQALTFDLRQSSVDSQFNAYDVRLDGGGITLIFDAGEPPATSWTHYRVPLDETMGWKHKDTGAAATQAEMLTVLSALEQLWIRGEYRVGGDTGGIDNVALAKSMSGRLELASQGKPHRIQLDLDRASAIAGQGVPLDILLLNTRNQITQADRLYLIRLDVPGGVVEPAEVQIPPGQRAAAAVVSANEAGAFAVRAVSEPRLPTNEAQHIVCAKGDIEDLAVAADRSGAPADNKTPIHLRIALISKNGTLVSDGKPKQIELVPEEIGRLDQIEPAYLPPNQCIQTAQLLSDRPGKAIVKASVGAFAKARQFSFYQQISAMLLLIVLAGGLLGALVRAATEWPKNKGWTHLKWALSLFVGAIGGLCLYLAYHAGVMAALPQLSGGWGAGLLLGLVGGYLGPMVFERLASRLLPADEPEPAGS